MNKLIGDYMRAFRIQKGWKLSYVAQQTGSDLSTMSRMERGGHRPSFELITRLSHLYGFGLDQLAEWCAMSRPPRLVVLPSPAPDAGPEDPQG